MNTLEMRRLRCYFQAEIVREEIREEMRKEMQISDQDDRYATVKLFALSRELEAPPRTGKDKWKLSESDGHAYGQRSQVSSSQRRLGNICSQMTKFITAVKMNIMSTSKMKNNKKGI